MAEAPKDPTAPARAELEAAHSDLAVARKKAIGDDGKILLAAAAAIELAIEYLTPPHTERALAAQSCREAVALMKITRAHGQGSASNAGMLLGQINERMARITGLL
ncbi:MAG TPA: hypothetical protein VE907_00505 [Gammaproteobacteria bacterium]|nr:hypothetical protein [Gammaproteobacteria bacterium]